MEPNDGTQLGLEPSDALGVGEDRATNAEYGPSAGRCTFELKEEKQYDLKWVPWQNKGFYEVNADDLYRLKDDEVSESYFIEYKRQWEPFKVARSIASFANTEGGTVIVGIEDRRATVQRPNNDSPIWISLGDLS